VIEHVDDDLAALVNIRDALADGGRAVVLVPQDPKLMGTLDEMLGHQRRYTVESLRAVAEQAGFAVQDIVHFNHVGVPAWWLNGKLLKRRKFGMSQIFALNTLTPVFRRIDQHLPCEALSLIAILTKAT